jgi:hypothetical protein
MDSEERLPAPAVISPFERIRRTNAAGAEYWSSRNCAQVLGYSDYRNFEQATKRAKTAFFISGQRVEDHSGEIADVIAERIKELGSRRREQPKAPEHPPSRMDATDTSQEENGM